MTPEARLEAIQKLAYSKWEAAGAAAEHSDSFWLEAEREIWKAEAESESKRLRLILKCGLVALTLLYPVLSLLHYAITPPTGSVKWISDYDEIKAVGTSCIVQSDRRIVRCREFDMVVATPLPRVK